MTKFLHVLTAAVTLSIGVSQSVVAQDRDVLLELFTSQGCSSCPPADAYLGELAEMDGVIALALHVDYWDYLGWRDQFAMPAMTARQRGYASSMKERSIYTPQMVVQGQGVAVGHNRREIEQQIAQMRAQVTSATVKATYYDDMLQVNVDPVQPGQTGVLHVVSYKSHATAPIAFGENRGKTLNHTNVVTSWSTVGAWEGDAKSYVLPMPEAVDGGIVVILQAGLTGPIIAVDRLD